MVKLVIPFASSTKIVRQFAALSTIRNYARRSAASLAEPGRGVMEPRILKVDSRRELGRFAPPSSDGGLAALESWEVASQPKETIDRLRDVAAYLRQSDIPVAFPTETVYGLGADATRSAAVKGIYSAKGRPSDNPLIVHVSDLAMLRRLLTPRPDPQGTESHAETGHPSAMTNGAEAAAAPRVEDEQDDTIPAIYRPLIERFWPGPLTILLPNPQPSRLAPEVTAGLPTFGARMPASGLARTLIGLAGTPLAAPSANASTRPSPTTARHVADDLRGRIEIIVDGGPCGVGVESTVVDGLCDPPVVLRPGGVGLEELRGVPGWERVRKAYEDRSEVGKGAPRAPGMKYKHYSPRARVVLYEAGRGRNGGGERNTLTAEDVEGTLRGEDGGSNGVQTVGVIRTQRWPLAGGLPISDVHAAGAEVEIGEDASNGDVPSSYVVRQGDLRLATDGGGEGTVRVLDLDLGRDAKSIAHGLFAALREFDARGADVIFVEGVSDQDDIGAAVMNRLRKAASDIRA